MPGLAQVKAKRTIEPTKEALLEALATYRARAAAAGHQIERVVSIYEAGWSGFWLARWLITQGVQVYVVQPSSVLTDRRMRRAKSDGIDAELLLRTLLAWLRGEPRVCSMVPIPAKPMKMRGGLSGNVANWLPSGSVWSTASVLCWRRWAQATTIRFSKAAGAG